jgi:hypothetical protein
MMKLSFPSRLLKVLPLLSLLLVQIALCQNSAPLLRLQRSKAYLDIASGAPTHRV